MYDVWNLINCMYVYDTHYIILINLVVCIAPTNNLAVCGLIPQALTNINLLSTMINNQ